MSPSLPGSRSRTGWVVLAVGLALAVGVLATLALTASAGKGEAERGRFIRHLNILVAAVLAVGGPHVLYPDPAARRLHLVNPSSVGLLRRQVGRWVPVVALASVPALAVALGGSAMPLVVEGVLAVWGLGAYVLARVAGLGVRARRWETGASGGWYRALYTSAPPARFLVPDALVPGLLLTGEVFLVGSTVSIAGQAGGGLAASFVLAALAGVIVARRTSTFDRDFWATHGTWADAFRQSSGPAEGRAALSYDGVYWAPPAIRPAVWAGLVGLDRRFPLGRVAALGLVLLVLVHVIGAEGGVRSASLAAWIISINGAIALTATDGLIPAPFARRLHGATGWALARTLMNLRWLPPLALTLAALAAFHDGVSAAAALAWTLADLAAAALSAIAVTAWAHARARHALL